MKYEIDKEFLMILLSLAAFLNSVAVLVIDIRMLGLPVEPSIYIFLNTILFTGLLALIIIQIFRGKRND